MSWDQGGVKLFGYKRDEIIGKKFSCVGNPVSAHNVPTPTSPLPKKRPPKWTRASYFAYPQIKQVDICWDRLLVNQQLGIESKGDVHE